MSSFRSGDLFRALVVDDMEGIHRDIRRILCPDTTSRSRLEELEGELLGARQEVSLQAQFHIDSAFQGEDGIALVERAVAAREPYAFAFVDVQMPPGIDGIDALARIWAIDPNIQAVVCTAYTDRSWEDMVRALGQTDRLLVLRKPFDPIEVLQLAHSLSYKWDRARQIMRRLTELEGRVAQLTG
jgi:CheY-like chemotaxis protein